jgi:hypothetical protein
MTPPTGCLRARHERGRVGVSCGEVENSGRGSRQAKEWRRSEARKVSSIVSKRRIPEVDEKTRRRSA